MTEVEFVESIDCRLPYGDQEQVRQFIEHGRGISPNSAFMVLHEICRPPKSARADMPALLELLAMWSASVSHPLNAVVLPIASSMIRGELIPVDVAMTAMREVALYPNQYNALAIPYFACDDVGGEVDALHKEITRAWAGA